MPGYVVHAVAAHRVFAAWSAPTFDLDPTGPASAGGAGTRPRGGRRSVSGRSDVRVYKFSEFEPWYRTGRVRPVLALRRDSPTTPTSC